MGSTGTTDTRLGNFSVKCPRQESNPRGSVLLHCSKSDLRNHCAIVQPRLYDSAMVTQITGALNLKERFHNRTFDVNRIHTGRLCASATVNRAAPGHVIMMIFVQGSLSGVHWEG